MKSPFETLFCSEHVIQSQFHSIVIEYDFMASWQFYNSNFPNLHTLILLTFTVNVGNSNPSFLRLKLKQTVLVLRIIFIT